MLRSLGVFSEFEIQLFNQNIESKTIEKNDVLISQGEISKSIFFIKTGALLQLQKIDDDEKIIDLNIQDLYNKFIESKVPIHPNGHLAKKSLGT